MKGRPSLGQHGVPPEYTGYTPHESMANNAGGEGVLRRITAGVLEVAYEEAGPADGTPIVLLHGFPYDVHAFDDVTPLLVGRGCRVIAPYLRGYGRTRFLSADTPRSGEQAALGHDLLALMDALSIRRAVVAGYDWGGRAACVVAALWPERVRGLVSCGGYNIQDIASSATPLPPEAEHRYWYQYYFHGERGRAGLARYRHELGKLLWRLWSPSWNFDDATYDRTASSFDNPDFVDVVIHSYRHRYALVPGDPAVEATEKRLAARPRIAVPTVVLHGADNNVAPLRTSAAHAVFWSGPFERRVIPRVGHNVPQEAPREFAAAVLSLAQGEGGTP
jgi:pimeloyl-ACP methyl ester carboxylesterase